MAGEALECASAQEEVVLSVARMVEGTGLAVALPCYVASEARQLQRSAQALVQDPVNCTEVCHKCVEVQGSKP